MAHPVASLTNEELIDALVRHVPDSVKDVHRADFEAAIFRYRAAMQAIPEGRGGARLLDVGARLYTAAVYVDLLHFAQVAVATKWRTSLTDEALLAEIPNGNRISLQHFDAEVDRFPYEDESFDVIVCTEVLEHLAVDPMHMLTEMGRTCRHGGTLIMTTPNAASLDALMNVLAGKHPYSWAPYNGKSTDRHNREYTLTELERAVAAAGFDIVRTETISRVPFSLKQRLLAGWFSLPDTLRGKPGLNLDRMGSNSLIVGRKSGPVRDRYPGWLYYDAGHGR